MSYTAKDLEEIAALFDKRAENYHAKFVENTEYTWTVRDFDSGAASAWTQAAAILRRTTLTEPCHMEKS